MLPLYFIFVTIVDAGAISAQIDIDSNRDLTIHHKIHNVDISGLFESLDKGYQSQIYLQVKLFRKKAMPAALLGDELIKNLEIYKNADVDFLTGKYSLSDKTDTSLYENKLMFLNNFLNCEIRFPMSELSITSSESYYIKIKATLIEKIYLQPFNILHLMTFNDSETTGWMYQKFIQEFK